MAPADTALVPDSGPTVASRTCMVVGKILQRCAQEMKRRLRGQHARRLPAAPRPPRGHASSYEKPAGRRSWDETHYRGEAYAAYAWGCDVVELEVDPVTFEVRPLRLTAVQEIGKAIHPMLARGQIEGGSVQGLG